MAKNQTVDKGFNIFSLSRFQAGCYYGTVSVDFNATERPNNLFEQIVPIYNKDKNYTTPAFILPNQQYYYFKNVEFHQEKFEERILGSHEKKSSQTLFNAIPSSSYCQICKQTYQHYTEHIISKFHQRKQRASKANLYINQLIQHLSHPQKCQDYASKTKNISKCQKGKNKGKRQKQTTSNQNKKGRKLPTTINKIHNNSTNVGSEILGVL